MRERERERERDRDFISFSCPGPHDAPEQQSILQEAQPDDSGNEPDVDAAVDAATHKLLQDLDRGQGLEPAVEQEDEAELKLAAAEACLIDTALGPLNAVFDDVAVVEEP